MTKKIASLFLLSILILGVYTSVAFAHNAGFPPTYDPRTMVIDTISEPESLDPAWAYDTTSSEVIMNVYETLVFFYNDWTEGPYKSGQTDTFDPILAIAVPTAYRTNGLPAGKVAALDFIIAPGHKFSDGNTVKPEDVAYSFERALIQDRYGGPEWMLYFPLLGTYRADTPGDDPNFDDRIDSVIDYNNVAGTVTIYFETSFPLDSWLQILSQTWCSVVEKSWAIDLGDFDGDFGTVGGGDWAAIYAHWHNPGESFIENNMMGSGPFKLDYWTHGVAYSIVKNPFYWQGFPATVISGDTGGERVSGSLDRIVWNYLPNWRVRSPRFLAGDSDMTFVPRKQRGAVVSAPGIRAYYPLEVLAFDAFFFTFNITTTSSYAEWNAPGVFTEGGLPPDIFSDINVRRGFAHAFDYNTWLTSEFLGEGEQPSDPIIKGIPYDNPAQEKYSFNLATATAELQVAWGGALWANGMTFTITYNIGNDARQAAATTIATNINSLNLKFHITTLGIPWSSTYLPQMMAGELPIFISGWQADYTDPDDFVFPFMHSQGTFARLQGYSNPRVDDLITFGATLPDDTAAYNGELDVANPIPLFNNYPNIPPDTRWPRRSIYYELQRIYFEDAPSVPLVQPYGRHYERDWVRGWYYNPLYGGSQISGLDHTDPTASAIDFYHLWKAQTHFGDTNNDGAVDVLDAGYVSAHWTAAGLPYNPAADINGGKGGLTGWEYVRGMSDGTVDIADIGLISAFFDGPPQGPAHP